MLSARALPSRASSSGLLQPGDIGEGEHGPGDVIVAGAVGDDAHLEPLPVAGADLAVFTIKLLDDRLQILPEFVVQKDGGDIGDGTPHVAFDEAEDPQAAGVKRLMRNLASTMTVQISVASKRLFMSSSASRSISFFF